MCVSIQRDLSWIYEFHKNNAKYFSAREWAKLAGRDDLLDKKISNLTKYYLCSDHFSFDAFMNPEVEDKQLLRLNKTLSIPIPTFFEDNLMENVKSVSENPEKFINYTKQQIVEIKHMKTYENSTVAKVQRRSLPISPEKQEKQDLPKVKLEQMAPEDMFELIETDDLVEYIDEDLEIERTHQTADSAEASSYCRLCARISDELMQIFDERGHLNVETECLKLMPNGLIRKDDGLPQYVCVECIIKLQSCISIVDGFVSNQSLFI